MLLVGVPHLIGWHSRQLEQQFQQHVAQACLLHQHQ